MEVGEKETFVLQCQTTERGPKEGIEQHRLFRVTHLPINYQIKSKDSRRLYRRLSRAQIDEKTKDFK